MVPAAGVNYPGINDVARVYHLVEVSGNGLVFNANFVTVMSQASGSTAELKVTFGATLNVNDLLAASDKPGGGALVRVTGNALPGHLSVNNDFYFDRGFGVGNGRVRLEVVGNSSVYVGRNFSYTYNDGNSSEGIAEVFIQDNGDFQVDGEMTLTMLAGGRCSFTVQETATTTLGGLNLILDGDVTYHNGTLDVSVLDAGTLNITNDLIANSNAYSNNTVFGNDILIEAVGPNARLIVGGKMELTNYGEVNFLKTIILNTEESGLIEVFGDVRAQNTSPSPQGFFAPDVDFNSFDDSEILIHGSLSLVQDHPNANILEISLNDNSKLRVEGDILMDSEASIGTKFTLRQNGRLELGRNLQRLNAVSGDAVESIDNATVEYFGTSTQTININSFVNLEINNSSNTEVYAVILNDDISVSGNLVFLDGVINTDGHVLSMANTGAVTGTVDDERHVIGTFSKFGISDFVFPVGNPITTGSTYRPFGAFNIQGDPAGSIAVRYVPSSPEIECPACDVSSLENPPLVKVSELETWVVAASDEIISFRPRLTWGANSDVSHLAVDRMELIPAIWHEGDEEWKDGGQSLIFDIDATFGIVQGGDYAALSSAPTMITLGSRIMDNPLPITWLSIDAKVVDQGVKITWETTEEVDNSHFEIQRAFDSQSFEEIGFLEGRNIADEVTTYTYVDDLRLQFLSSQKRIFYRIKQVDFSGSYDYSEVVSVAMNKPLATSPSVHPNPFIKGYSASLKISNLESHSPINEVHLFDYSGNELATHKGDYPELSDFLFERINGLEGGIYIIIFNRKHKTKIIVK